MASSRHPVPVPIPVAEPDHQFGEHDHAACAASAMDAGARRVADQGARMTPVRQRALEILLESHRAMGAYEVLGRLAAEGFGHQPPVAYRALDFLVEHGLAHKVQRLNAFAACLHPGHDHAPAFLICRVCQRTAEADAAGAAQALGEAAEGFRVERLTIEALGLCPACAADPASASTPASAGA